MGVMGVEVVILVRLCNGWVITAHQLDLVNQMVVFPISCQEEMQPIISMVFLSLLHHAPQPVRDQPTREI